MTHTPSDRVQVRQLGDLQHPGACALCGNGTCNRGYVDLDIYYDYEGQVYLCMFCAEDVAELIGALLPAQSTHLETLNSEIAVKLKELEAENERLNSELSTWRSLIDDALDRRNARTDVEQSEQPSAEPSSEPADGAVKGKPVAKKSTSGRRLTNSSQPTAGNFTV